MKTNENIVVEDYYKDKILSSDIPSYWKASQINNMRIAQHLFDDFRSGIYHSYNPLQSEKESKLSRRIEGFLLSLVGNSRYRESVKIFFLKKRIKQLRKQIEPLVIESFLGKEPLIPQFTLGTFFSNFLPSFFDVHESLVGNPIDLFLLKGKPYSYEFVEKFIRSELIRRDSQIETQENSFVVDVGGSFGLQIEVLKKRFPQNKFILIETPSQAYTAWKYLKKVFPNSKIIAPHELTDESDIAEFEISILLNDQLSTIGKKPINISSMINQRSFQEMEWRFVKDYLHFFSSRKVSSIHIWLMPDGFPHVPKDQKTNQSKIKKFLKEKGYILENENLEMIRHDFKFTYTNYNLK